MAAVNFISPSTQPLQLQYTVACTCRQAGKPRLYMYSLWYIRYMKRHLGQNSHFSVDAILFYRCVLYQS